MYLGRIVAAGMTAKGQVTAAYRVSSRSFPNRTANLSGETVSIIPRKGFEADLSKNPYIAYNCIRLAGAIAVATNGSQTDPIVEKIAAGMSMRDAFALSLLAMDYEKDQLDTPRIAAAVDAVAGEAVLGIVRRDALLVRTFKLEPGKMVYLSTYNRNSPTDGNVDTSFFSETPIEVCRHVISESVFGEFENPVTAAAAVWTGTNYRLAVKDAE